MRRVGLMAAAAALIAAGCGGGGAGAPPPGTGPGSIAGTVSVSVALMRARALNAIVSPTLRRIPPGAPAAAPDQLLVKFRPGLAGAQASDIHKQFGAAEVRRARRTGISLMRIVSGEPLNTVLARYRSHPGVAYAEPNYYRYLTTATTGPPLQANPNDPGYPFQWHYAIINLSSAWNTGTGSSLVVVAVIDSGILFSHEDLAGVTVSGFDFVQNDADPTDPGCPGPTDLSHGAHVAGTVAAATNNGIGVAGVNWGGSGRTKIMPLRAFGDIGGNCATTVSTIIDAIEYAADHSARVINMSFGSTSFSQAEQDAVNYAHSTGVTLVAAAGNDPAFDCSGFYPAAYANVIGVAATTITNTKASYSSAGSCVDLAAPGGELTTDVNMDGFADGVLSTSGTPASPSQYVFFQGTSMASPHVAGLAALLISKGMTGPSSILGVMQSTATDLGTPGCDTTFGCGLINAASALGASAAINPVRAFVGTISGSTITVTSPVVSVASNGVYLVPDVQPGTRTVFAWQDSNGNGLVDTGDLSGSTSGIVVAAGTTTAGANVSITEVPLGAGPITVTGLPP